MEPEYELALKVSSYIDLLWDRADLQEIIRSEGQTSLKTIFARERIDVFLAALGTRDAVLRRAIDTSSLFLPRSAWRVSNAASVIPKDETENPERQSIREIKGVEDKADLANKARLVLRHDFLGNETPERSLAQAFSDPVLILRRTREKPEENQPSFEAIRRELSGKFYRDPELAARIADWIDYFPSYTLQLARKIYQVVAGISGWEPLEAAGFAQRLARFLRHRVYNFGLFLKGKFRTILRSDRRHTESPTAAAWKAMVAVQDENVSQDWTGTDRDPRNAFEAFCWFFVEYRNADGGETESRQILRALCQFLLRRPRLGYFMAKALAVPVPFGIAFGEELDEIAQSKALRMDAQSKRETKWRDPYEAAREKNLSGICLSGGGIRSATFNLGVLQGLSDLRMLRQFDYLSTVSGGGYIGSWLASWTLRAGSIKTVETLIQRRRKLNPLGEDIHPIRWLREYSHYLTPQSGAVTTDTLTLVAVYLRNVFLNQALLLFVFAALLLFPLLWFPVLGVAASSIWPLLISAGLVLWFSAWIGACLRDFKLQNKPGRLEWERYGPQFIRSFIVLPAVAGSIVVAFALWSGALERGDVVGWAAPLTNLFRQWRATAWLTKSGSLMITFVITAIGLLVAHIRGSWEAPRIKPLSILYVLGVVPPAAVAALCFETIRRILLTWGMDTQAGAWMVLVFGPPLVLAAWSGTIVAYLGIVGLAIGEERREWWARLGAVIGAAAAAYLLITSTAVYGPLLIWRSTYLNLSLASLWTAVTGLGMKFGAAPPDGSANGGKSATAILKSAVTAIAPFVFIAGLFLFLSWCVFRLTALGQFGSSVGSASLFAHYWQNMGELNQVRYNLFLAFAAAALGLGFTVGVNEFSMHNFYKNRLVRAYLAASRSRKRRRPNPFTGFDLGDDIPLYRFQVTPPVVPGGITDEGVIGAASRKGKKPQVWLTEDEERPPSELQPSYIGPFLILNAALNVTKGQDLALQERKGESFTFTPLRCGFQYTRPRTGMPREVIREFAYCRTEAYAYDRGPNIGAAMAISGAAANPNWGSGTNAGIAFLLTLFNIRLGWWIGNPAGPKFNRSSPQMGLIYLLSNLIGSAGAESNYINLSDGGHFDNSGLYELVRRRCKYIMICDAEQDGDFTFGALGSAIRKARIDFGAEVKIDVRNLCPVGKANSKCHCAAGEIVYDDQTTGKILYLKLSLDGGEPTDILEYKKRAPAFPHQTTADQFFSESQFESYRMLGYYSVLQTWNPVVGNDTTTLAEAFDLFAGAWPEPSSVDTELRPHYDRLLSAHTWISGGAVTETVARERIALTHRLYHELRLDDEADRVVNRGIVDILSGWKGNPIQIDVWLIVRDTYEKRFILFYEGL